MFFMLFLQLLLQRMVVHQTAARVGDTLSFAWQQYANYWAKYPVKGDVSCAPGTAINGCPNYADVMIMAALNAKGDYAKIASAGRAQV